MIPRSLVPFDARPSTLEPTSRRRPSTLDDRTLVPSGLPLTALETKSTIPANLPLDSIAARVVVPRDVRAEAYQVVEKPGLPPQPSELDERITVPLGAAPPEVIPPPASLPTELVEKDVFLTGEVNFLRDEEAAKKQSRENLVERASSILIHVAILALLSFPPKFLRRRPPTAEDLEIARKQMVLLVPPGGFDLPRSEPRVVTPPPRVKVDPRVLRRIAPPEPVLQPQPQPAPPQPKVEARELPSAPTPNSVVRPDTVPPQTTPKLEVPANPTPKLETPDSPTAPKGLILPKNTSPGRSIEESLKGVRPQAPAIGGGGQLPSGGSPGGGGGRQGQAYGAMELLTPTEGVDFRDYLNRVYITVKRNWYAVMPTSVSLGDKGIVSLQFKINRDGSVPTGMPLILRTSEKEPLDRAAVSSIRSSNPFEPLPPAFTGPFIELRFTYYYNLTPPN